MVLNCFSLNVLRTFIYLFKELRATENLYFVTELLFHMNCNIASHSSGEQWQRCVVTIIVITITHVTICITWHTVLCEWRQETGCAVLTLCDGQLAVPASNCTLCGYVLEYYCALLLVCLSQLMFVIFPYIYFKCNCNKLYIQK